METILRPELRNVHGIRDLGRMGARLLGPLKMSGKQTGWIYATLPLTCIVSPLVAGLMQFYFLGTA